MADFTMRDAGKLEAERQKMFSHLRGVRLVIYDRTGEEVGSVVRYWSRKKKTTREQAVFYLFQVADLKEEFADAMRAAGDGGTLGVKTRSEGEARYKVTTVEAWTLGEPRVWTITANAQTSPSSSFFKAP